MTSFRRWTKRRRMSDALAGLRSSWFRPVRTTAEFVAVLPPLALADLSLRALIAAPARGPRGASELPACASHSSSWAGNSGWSPGVRRTLSDPLRRGPKGLRQKGAYSGERRFSACRTRRSRVRGLRHESNGACSVLSWKRQARSGGLV